MDFGQFEIEIYNEVALATELYIVNRELTKIHNRGYIDRNNQYVAIVLDQLTLSLQREATYLFRPLHTPFCSPGFFHS